MTVPQWFLLMSAVCFAVRALFGVVSLVDARMRDDSHGETNE